MKRPEDLNDVITKIELSHRAIADTISNFGAEVKENSQKTQEAQIRFTEIVTKLNEISAKIENFITRDQFWPVKTLVYGAVTVILVAVVGAGVALIIAGSSSKITAQANVISD